MDSEEEFTRRWEEFIEQHGHPRPSNFRAIAKWFHLSGKHDGVAGCLRRFNEVINPDQDGQ